MAIEHLMSTLRTYWVNYMCVDEHLLMDRGHNDDEGEVEEGQNGQCRWNGQFTLGYEGHSSTHNSKNTLQFLLMSWRLHVQISNYS